MRVRETGGERSGPWRGRGGMVYGRGSGKKPGAWSRRAVERCGTAAVHVAGSRGNSS